MRRAPRPARLAVGGRLHRAERLGGLVGDRDQVQILLRDLALAQGAFAQPGDQTAPVITAHQYDREIAHLAGLDQGQRLEQLVERAESARKHDEAARVPDEHDLAGEEVVELEPVFDEAIHSLLERQLDIESDRVRSSLARAAVGGLHDSRSAACDDREARLSEQLGGLPREGILTVILGRLRGPEDRHGGADVGQRLEARPQLARADPLEAGPRR